MEEVKSSPNSRIVGLLEDLLEHAKLGKLQGVAVAGVEDSCSTFNCFAGYYPIYLLGEIRVLERDLMDLQVDIRRKPVWEVCE